MIKHRWCKRFFGLILLLFSFSIHEAKAWPDPGVRAYITINQAKRFYMHGLYDHAEKQLLLSQKSVPFQYATAFLALIDIEKGSFARANVRLAKLKPDTGDYGFFSSKDISYLMRFSKAKMALFKGKYGEAAKGFQNVAQYPHSPGLNFLKHQTKHFRKKLMIVTRPKAIFDCYQPFKKLKKIPIKTLKKCTYTLQNNDPHLKWILRAYGPKVKKSEIIPFLKVNQTQIVALNLFSPHLSPSTFKVYFQKNGLEWTSLVSLNQHLKKQAVSPKDLKSYTKFLLKEIKTRGLKKSNDLFDKAKTPELTPASEIYLEIFRNLILLQKLSSEEPVLDAYIQSVQTLLKSNNFKHTRNNSEFHWLPESGIHMTIDDIRFQSKILLLFK